MAARIIQNADRAHFIHEQRPEDIRDRIERACRETSGSSSVFVLRGEKYALIWSLKLSSGGIEGCLQTIGGVYLGEIVIEGSQPEVGYAITGRSEAVKAIRSLLELSNTPRR